MCMPQNSKIFQQKRIRFLGEIVDSIFTAMPALSAYSIVSTTIILYEITKQYILNWVPWMNVVYFVLILVVLFIPLLLFTYKFIIPSVWQFRSTQMKHLEDKIDRIEAMLKEERENRGS